MTIKEVSEKYNISADTIRYYERIGLIPPVPRKPMVFVILTKNHVIGLNLYVAFVMLEFKLKH